MLRDPSPAHTYAGSPTGHLVLLLPLSNPPSNTNANVKRNSNANTNTNTNANASTTYNHDYYTTRLLTYLLYTVLGTKFAPCLVKHDASKFLPNPLLHAMPTTCLIIGYLKEYPASEGINSIREQRSLELRNVG